MRTFSIHTIGGYAHTLINIVFYKILIKTLIIDKNWDFKHPYIAQD